MREFSGYLEMKECEVDDFLKVPEMNRKAAENLYNYLHMTEGKKEDGNGSGPFKDRDEAGT